MAFARGDWRSSRPGHHPLGLHRRHSLEYFEGEPEIGPDGEACVRFKSTLARLFYVSQIWTEYGPEAHSWKAFYAKKTGDNPDGFSPCHEDGSTSIRE